MAGKTRGRKSKLTRERVDGLVALLEAGIPRNTACAGVGIDPRTLRIWMTRAEKGQPRFVEFAETVQVAIAKGRVKLLMQIARHGNRDFRAPAWILEHAHSEEFSSKSQLKLELDPAVDRILDAAEKLMTADQYEKLVSRIAAAAEGGGEAEEDPASA